MDAPLGHVLWEHATDSPQRRVGRDIETHYHIGMAAENTRQIRDLQAAQLGLQASQAAQMHSDLAQLGFGMDALGDQMGAVYDQLGQVGRGVAELNATAQDALGALLGMHGMLDEWLSTLSEQLSRQQATMTQIAEDLRKPLQTEVLEMRKHADHALTSGMRAQGDEAREWYGDALELLGQAVENPVGKQDYVAWFQIGWIRWKLERNHKTAEQAFGRAARLSKPAGDPYYVESLRHLAHARYLQTDLAGALDAILQAEEADPSPQVLYDGARYRAVNGSAADAALVMERALRAHPPLVIPIIGEPDFGGMLSDVQAVIARLTEEARANASECLDAWGRALHAAAESAQIAGHQIPTPEELSTRRLDELRSEVGNADYLRSLEIGRVAREASATVTNRAVEELQALCERRQASLADAVGRIRDTTSQAKEEKARTMAAWEEAQREANDQLATPAPGGDYNGWFQGGCVFQVVCLVLLFVIRPQSWFWDKALGIPAVCGFALLPAVVGIYRHVAKGYADAGATGLAKQAMEYHLRNKEAVDARLARDLVPLAEDRLHAQEELDKAKEAHRWLAVEPQQ